MVWSKIFRQGTVTVGVSGCIYRLCGRLWQPINNLGNFYNSVLSAMASTERIFEMLEESLIYMMTIDAKEMPPIRGEVVFENVNFHYEPEKPVLRDVVLV